jgi:hypothetical protein
VVVWEELVRNRSIYFRRFTRDGVPIDPPRRRVPPPLRGEQRWPMVACAGSAMLVAWIEEDFNGSVYMRHRGALLAPGMRDPIAIDLGEASSFGPRAIASDGREFVTLVHRFNLVEIYRRDTTGARVGTLSGVAGRRILASSIAWNGSEYLLVWSFEDAVHAARLSRTLEFIGDTVEITKTTTHSVVEIGIAPSPHGWLVAWVGTSLTSGDFFRAASLQLTRELAPLDPVGGIPFAMDDGDFGVAWNGCAYEIHLRSRTIVRPPFGKDVEIATADPRLAVAAGATERFVVSSSLVEDSRRLYGAIEPMRCER